MDSLTTFGYTKDGKVFLKGYFDFPDREIGLVKESEEASLQYFIKRFELAESKVAELAEAIQNTTNKGSYLMKLVHMRTYLAEFNGLGDFPSLFRKLDELEAEIRSYIHENRIKNHEIKTNLLKEAEVLSQGTNWNVFTKKFKELKLRWIKTGSTFENEEESFNKAFDNYYNTFFERKNQFFEQRKALLESRRIRYEEILAEMARINAEMPENAQQEITRLQKQWKVVGKINARFFKELTKKMHAEVKIFNEKLKRLQERINANPIERKKELCEKVEGMLRTDEPLQIALVKSIQAEWKRLGKLKHPMDKDYNTRFKIACNEIFETFFLDQTAKTKYEHFSEKTRFEQLKIKIRLLKDSIKEDEFVLNQLNARDGYSANRRSGDSEGSSIDMEKLNQINKLKTKQRILKKLQSQLMSNY
ncbi:DUF349 domain-containing protein [Rhodoflexus caldus]|uniref:DUF349 domain-containing protein n=1 Tax=Rhodoflexus caldus TaxID=2891236 RepID=UPI00202A694C|nr:DUF349 domain-containing protein [Rhodoflexus caldus]